MGIKKMYLIWGILVLMIMIAGSYAYFSWKTSESRLVLTVGDINNVQVILKPYKIDTDILPVLTYENETYASIDVINNSNKTRRIELYYHINKIDEELKNDDFKYTITKSTDGGSTFSEIKTGTFSSAEEDQNITIFSNNINSATEEKYRVYIWLNGSEDGQTNIIGKSFEAELRANLELDTLPNAPVLDNGMIPIVFDTSDGTVIKTVSSTDSSWYDYSSQKWANVVLVKESGTKTRAYYKANPGVTVNESDILAYYVWVPRYSYKVWTARYGGNGKEQTIDIVFETKETIKTDSTVGEYLIHPAFWWDSDSDGVRDSGEELAGIWVGKFETTGSASSPTILPNITSLRNQKVSTQFTTAKLFGGTAYGNTSKVDAHMSKNSEWGVVAYLSHSKYGVNREVYINNSGNFYTGRSGGNASGSTQANKIYPSQSSTSLNNTYGYYTWDGYLLEYNTNTKSSTRDLTKVASTTGNITGVYDMSGGAYEYVMAYYSNASSTWGAASDSNYAGFSSKPNSKYYDDYTTTSVITACNGGLCYGHALSETYQWYSDAELFLTASKPWPIRGGAHNDEIYSGTYSYDSYSGAGYTSFSFRSIIVNIN